MTNLTIRIDEELKKKAARLAKKLGIPLSAVIKNALRDFIHNPEVKIGQSQSKKVSPKLEEKIDQIFEWINKKENLKFSPFENEEVPISQINAESSSFDFLANEQDIYSISDLKESYV